MAPFKSEFEGVAPPDPRKSVGENKTIGDGQIIIAPAESLVSDVEIVPLEGDWREHGPACVGDSENLGPIRPVYALGLAWIV